MTRHDLFSEREREVVGLLLQGKSNKQIALALVISEHTVEFHLKNVYAKLGARSRVEAILKLGKLTGFIAGDKLRESAVDEMGRSSENGDMSVLRRIFMKKPLVIIGGIGLGIALIAVLFAALLLVNGPAKGVPFVSVTSILPLEMSSTDAASPIGSSKEHILAQIRQLAAEYDQAVQAEKQNGKVEFSQDPSTGQEMFRFTDESYQRISELYLQFMEQKTQLEQLYTAMYRDETQPTPFPTGSSAEQNQVYYDTLMEQADNYCSLESWQQDRQAESISVYDPDEGRYRSIFMGDVIARCEVYGQMLEELRVASILEKIDRDHDMALIRQVVGKPDLQLMYQSIQPLANAPVRSATLYVDETGAKYYVDIESARLVGIQANFITHPEIPADEVKSMDELRGFAGQFAHANSPRLAQLNKDLLYEEGCKENICFFRWDARNIMDWSGTDWVMMPPFLQVGLLMDGQIANYINTLDLFEDVVSVALPQPTPQAVIGGGTIQDGYFDFDLRLYRDPRLDRQPVTTSMYSDMDGIGAWMYWFYKGPDVIGPVETFSGTLPRLDQLLQETYASIRLGSSGGRSGGILLPGGFFLPGESKAGDRVQVALKVITPDGEYGAVIAFTLEQGVNGFEPTDILVDVLRSVAPVWITPSARLSGATATYTDPVIGYSIDYPENWYLQVEPGWVVFLTSFPLKQDGVGGLRSDQAKIDLAPTKPYECESLQQLVKKAKQGEAEILWEQQWLLAGEIPAFRMQRDSDVFGQSALLLTVINGRCLNVVGMGDTTLFDAIASSLRPSP